MSSKQQDGDPGVGPHPVSRVRRSMAYGWGIAIPKPKCLAPPALPVPLIPPTEYHPVPPTLKNALYPQYPSTPSSLLTISTGVGQCWQL